MYAPMIAYTTLFSMFPIMLAVLTIVSLLVGDPATVADAEEALTAVLPPNLAAEVRQVLEGTYDIAGVLGLISLLGLFWGGSELFRALERAFSRIYEVPPRSIVKQRVLAFVMIFVFAILLILAIASTSLAQILIAVGADIAAIEDGVWIGYIGSAVSWLLSLGFGLLLFLVIYRVVPNAALTLGDVWPGSIFGTVVFFILLQVFPLYVRLAGGMAQFGALFGFFFVVLTWFYLLAYVLLLGASLNAVLHPHRRGDEGNLLS